VVILSVLMLFTDL